MTDNPLPHLEFHLLGIPHIRCNGVVYTSLTAAKAQAIFYYLAMTGLDGRPTHSRAALAPLLWGECSDSDARGNLRKAIQHLREQFDSYLQIDNQMLGLRAATAYTVDAVAFAQAMTNPRTAPAEQLQAAIALYHGDFLAGFYVREAPDFEAWMLSERARLRELMLQGVETLALRYVEQGDLPQAITMARRLLTLEPWREETHRQLMTWLAQNGQRSAALAQYELCCRALREELAVESSQATRDLYARLLDQEERTVASATTAVITTEYMLVGRQQEWQTLQAAWTETLRTGVHFVCIAGEAGIGKTRLAEELLVYAQRQGYATAYTRTYALEGRLAYGPVADWLRSEPLRTRLNKLNKVWLSEVARLLPELLIDQPDLPPPPPLTERWQQKQLFDALVQAFSCDPHPLLLLLDDLQWCDVETFEWVHYLLGAAPQAKLLLVGTLRIEEVEESHPLHKLWGTLLREGKLTTIDLSPLTAQETAALGTAVAKQALDATAAGQLYRETAGNPLFVVESVRASQERDLAELASAPFFYGVDDQPQANRRLPPKVYGVIQSRLAQLSVEAHTLAQLAAAVGRPFTVELLLQAGQQDEETVVRSLDELWRRRLVREQMPGNYDFSHDRMRDVAYAELSPIRRRSYHRRIAQALVQLAGATGDLLSGQIATHYDLAGLPEQAVSYYQQATDTARRIYANHEVIHYLQKGISLFPKLPGTSAYRQQELAMQVDLAAALMETQGWAAPEPEQAYARAFDLCQQIEQTEYLFPILWGLHEVYLFQAKYAPARAMAEQCMALAQRAQDPALLLQAHHAMWGVLSLLAPGETELALQHAEQGMAIYNPQQHHTHVHLYGGHDPGICSRMIAASVLWQLGYPDQAQRRGEEAIQIGYQLAHPFSLAIALVNIAALYLHRREIDTVLDLTAKATTIATERNFPLLLAQCQITHGWAIAMQDNLEQGLAFVQEGVGAWRRMGILLRQPDYLLLLAEVYIKSGQFEAALRTLDEAVTTASATGERFGESAIHRHRGEIWLAAGKAADAAETAFHQALQVARQQKMKLLELRAAVSLSRLWQQQGKIAEARELLAGIYHWFTEGFDTVDLREAKALLDKLQTC